MKLFALIPKDFSLSKKLTILMLAVFLSGIIISSVVYYNVLFGYAKNDLNIQANLLISTIDSVRKYNNDKITPLLEKQSNEKLLLESIPSFATREVFDILTSVYQDKYRNYLYKDAMLNPTNIKDKATNEEIKIVEKFSQQDRVIATKIDEGFITIDGDNYFYTARPIAITQSSCLRCHTSLEKSPKSLQVLYEQGKYQGDQGFGWELNQVIGTKIVYIPANKVYQNTKQNFVLILGIFTAIFAVAIFLVNLWLKQFVVRPLNQITQVAEAVSLGDLEADFEKQSNDEIGRLAEAFTRLKTSLVIAIRRLTQRAE
jgi:methyl-accepting chemotaxis protein